MILYYMYRALYTTARQETKKGVIKFVSREKRGGNEMWDKLRSYDYDDEQGGKEKSKRGKKGKMDPVRYMCVYMGLKESCLSPDTCC